MAMATAQSRVHKGAVGGGAVSPGHVYSAQRVAPARAGEAVLLANGPRIAALQLALHSAQQQAEAAAADVPLPLAHLSVQDVALAGAPDATAEIQAIASLQIGPSCDTDSLVVAWVDDRGYAHQAAVDLPPVQHQPDEARPDPARSPSTKKPCLSDSRVQSRHLSSTAPSQGSCAAGRGPAWIALEGATHGDSGWTSQQAPRSVTLHQPSQSVCVAHDSRLLRTLSTACRPCALLWPGQRTHQHQQQSHSFWAGSHLLLVAEYNQLAVYDTRIAQGAACVHRTASFGDVLNTIAEHSQGGVPLIGVAGHNKAVHVIDPRKWQKVNSCFPRTKYQITKLLFSQTHPELCYTCSLGNELVCTAWDGSRRLNSSEMSPAEFNVGFRADSRWIGLVPSGAQHDALIGVCESGSVYALERPYLIAPAQNPQQMQVDDDEP